MLKVGIVVGEHSGDMLGAGLVRELKKHVQDIHIEGILGPELMQAGGSCLFPMDKLAVIGISEIFGKYLDIVSIRNQVKCHFIGDPPDIFIGIDAPDFNIPLERQLRAAGVKTIHYVSPSVWAWRKNRIRDLVSAVDLLLTLYPFEQDYYQHKNIQVEYVGHPLADKIPLKPDMQQARAELGLEQNATYICLMPGSRTSELNNHVSVFAEAAKWCIQYRPDLRFLCCFQNKTQCEQYSHILNKQMDGLPLEIFVSCSLRVMDASNVVLLASGTAALEAMLLKKPMVVAYRVNSLSYLILRHLIKIPYVSIPNILYGDRIVPEYLQDEMTPERLGSAIMHWLESPDSIRHIESEFTRLHETLENQADCKAANAILRLCQ